MKTLVLVRHAQAVDEHIKADFQRKLTPYGIRQAALASHALHEQKIQPKLVFCSAAARTQQTAQIIAKRLDYDVNRIKSLDALYASRVITWKQIIAEFPDTADVIIGVGHNPEISQLVADFSPTPIQGMQTATYALLQFDADSWHDVVDSKAVSCEMKENL